MTHAAAEYATVLSTGGKHFLHLKGLDCFSLPEHQGQMTKKFVTKKVTSPM